MRTALLFPGQGAQYVGMLGDSSSDPLVADTLAQADEALSLPLSRWIAEGPADKLASTPITQPAVLTVSVALWRLLRQRCPDLDPMVAAGHSLGEYSALVAAGSLDFQDAVRLVHLRGRLMQDAVPRGRGGMLAVLGAKPAWLEAACDEVTGLGDGSVWPACFNGPGQVVVAGHVGALSVLAERCRESDACRGVVELDVSAPFHTPMLDSARRGLELALQEVRLAPPAFPIVQNVDAVPTLDPIAIRDKLVRQVTEPVLWEPCARALLELGPERAIEVGPGSTLAGLLRRIKRRFPVVCLDRSGAWEAL